MGGPSAPRKSRFTGPWALAYMTESARGGRGGGRKERIGGSSTRGCKLFVQASMSHCAHILDLSASFSKRCVLQCGSRY